ncbi:hypothetical protein Pfo_005222 [Paulownia fortunei]|nr:hypothetical protein Pfo_005222 [Paulownia fortunei]
MHFTNNYVNAQVINTPTATVASAASIQEKALRLSMERAKESTRDVAAAAKIGKILGERLLLQKIPAVSVSLKSDQKYHGKFWSEPGDGAGEHDTAIMRGAAFGGGGALNKSLPEPVHGLVWMEIEDSVGDELNSQSYK